ncbi:MAG: twin-arginine translocation signal domain-containing protein [Pirellulaceae bacterium]
MTVAFGNGDPLDRRDFLHAAGGLGVALALPSALFTRARAAESDEWRGVTTCLESLARPDGGYGWPDQQR